jgi:hypothetical protein
MLKERSKLVIGLMGAAPMNGPTVQANIPMYEHSQVFKKLA